MNRKASNLYRLEELYILFWQILKLKFGFLTGEFFPFGESDVPVAIASRYVRMERAIGQVLAKHNISIPQALTNTTTHKFYNSQTYERYFYPQTYSFSKCPSRR